MKKVININFQGRVIPIEETASDLLQKYTASLRNYFINEEGRDEIINDIENRIAELFSETLKNGAACITDADVNKVINNMGRPEDFDQADDESGSRQQQPGAERSGARQYDFGTNEGQPYPKKRLYRDEEDKILGGVASGLANYLNVDPAVIRIMFAVLGLAGGSGFLIYIVLWIVLPSRSLETSIRKRLYRDADNRVIAGVAGGLAKYFDINPAIPRVIFAAPFILGIIASVGNNIFNSGFFLVGSSGGGTFILAYIILWLVLPEAKTSAEKLEMKGEKVDLNSIRNTVMGDLQGAKGRAEKMGGELKAGATRLGDEAKEAWDSKGKPFVSEARQAVKKGGSGIGNAIATLVKAFVLFIVGMITLSLFFALVFLLSNGGGILPLKDFLFENGTQQALALGTIVLFIGVPIVGFIVWVIRRLMRVKSRSKFLGFSIAALWVAGWVVMPFFAASVSRSFRGQVGRQEDVSITQPSGNTLTVKIANAYMTHYDGLFELDGLVNAGSDSLYLNTVRVNVVQSKDSLYHLHLVKMSRGTNGNDAEKRISKISFPIQQTDSLVFLPETFTVGKADKWRNQRVLVVIEVPVGKNIRLDGRISEYDDFNIQTGNRRNWRMDWNRNWEDGEYWREDRDLKMTPGGLQGNEDNEQSGGWNDPADPNDAPGKRNRNSRDAKPDSQGNDSGSEKPYRYNQSNISNRGDALKPADEEYIILHINGMVHPERKKPIHHPLSLFRI